MKNKDIKTIVILGMHKTGTSIVAGALARLGVDMGRSIDQESKRDDISNPLGHYEDWDFQKLNKKILKKANGDWKNPPKKENIIKQKNKFQKQIKNLINKKESTLWGFKDPRTTLTIDLFLPYLKNPYFLICHRKDKDVIDSIQRRIADRGDKEMSDKEIKKIINQYKSSIKSFFKQNPNLKRLDIDFKKLNNKKRDQIEKIMDFLNLNPTQKQKEKAIQFILPKKEIKKKRFKNLIRKGIKKPWKIPGFIIRKLKSK